MKSQVCPIYPLISQFQYFCFVLGFKKYVTTTHRELFIPFYFLIESIFLRVLSSFVI